MGKWGKRPREAQQPFACVEGLPADWDAERLKSALVAGGVGLVDVRKDVRKASWAYVTFASAEDEGKAGAVLDCLDVGEPSTSGQDGGDGGEKAPPKPSRKARRRKFQRPPRAKRDPATINIADVVCPLRDMPYSEQLLLKQGKVVEALARITDKVCGKAKNAGVTPEWLPAALEHEQQLACPLLGIVRSPQRDGYRNKCEFTCGTSPEGLPTVGFLLGSFMQGITEVGEPRDCRHTPDSTLAVAGWMTEFLRSRTQLPVWDKRCNNGFWRLLTVREGRAKTWLPPPGQAQSADVGYEGVDWQRWLVDTGAAGEGGAPGVGLRLADVDALAEPSAPMCDELLVMVQVNSEYTTPELAAAECAALGRHLLERAAAALPPLPLRCLLRQDHAGCSNAAQPDAPVVPMIADPVGEEARYEQQYIHDTLCGLRFRVSSGAFFQVNNGAAAVLYALAGSWASADGRALLFDVCCGTGTIGLSLARRVREVVGVELVPQAVEDARANAALNGIDNCTWVCDKAEVAMRALLENLPTLQPQQPQQQPQPPAEAAANGAMPAAVPQLNGAPTPDLAAAAAATQHGGSAAGGRQYSTQYSVFSEIVAIVDPPRAGLHPSVLKALLRCESLKRIVYVSCNPETLATNCVDLCSPPQPSDYHSQTYKRARAAHSGGKPPPPWVPFRPVRAVGVDLFPHTKHCEAVMLLER